MAYDNSPNVNVTLRWDLDLSALLNIPVRIETKDGCLRETRIQSVEFSDVELVGYTCPVPHRFILDDSMDFIQISNIKTVTLM